MPGPWDFLSPWHVLMDRYIRLAEAKTQLPVPYRIRKDILALRHLALRDHLN